MKLIALFMSALAFPCLAEESQNCATPDCPTITCSYVSSYDNRLKKIKLPAAVCCGRLFVYNEEVNKCVNGAGVEGLNSCHFSHPNLNSSDADDIGVLNECANLKGAHVKRVLPVGAPLDCYFEYWNTWTGVNGGSFRGTDLSGASLMHLDITVSNWTGAKFKGTDFTNTHFVACDLRKAEFVGAKLLGNATLRGSDLRGADLRGIQVSESCHQENQAPLSVSASVNIIGSHGNAVNLDAPTKTKSCIDDYIRVFSGTKFNSQTKLPVAFGRTPAQKRKTAEYLGMIFEP